MMKRVPAILSTLAILLKRPFSKASSFGAGRSRSSTAIYPHHGRAHPRNRVLAPHSSMLQPSGDERSPSIYTPSQLVTSVMPGVSEQTYWLLVEKMGPSTIYNIFICRQRDLYPHEWPQAAALSSYSHDGVFAGSQPQGLPGVLQSWANDKKTLTTYIWGWNTAY